jgi:hypothetical protein
MIRWVCLKWESSTGIGPYHWSIYGWHDKGDVCVPVLVLVLILSSGASRGSRFLDFFFYFRSLTTEFRLAKKFLDQSTVL